ncbi:Clp ATPase [Yersinia aleksiciae]|nr:Clp ATPase [Yersinia aleksiciae]
MSIPSHQGVGMSVLSRIWRVGGLTVLSQQLLGRMSELQRTTMLTLGWDEAEGITLGFGNE